MSLGSTGRTQLPDSVAKLAARTIPAVVVVPTDEFTAPDTTPTRTDAAASSVRSSWPPPATTAPLRSGGVRRSMAAPLAAGTAAPVCPLNPDMQPKNIARRMVRLSSALCGTRLRQVDAAAALLNVVPPDNGCR